MNEKKQSTQPAILIVDDDDEFLSSIEAALKNEYRVIAASSKTGAEEHLGSNLSLVLLDIRLNSKDPDNREGLELLDSFKINQPQVPVVMMTAYADIDTAVKALRLGASDFVQKSTLELQEFRQLLKNTLERVRLERKLDVLEQDIRRRESWEIVGDEPAINEMRDQIDMVAQDGRCTVLIKGATGTGKELVARAIHERGWRKGEPFVSVSIAGLPESLIEGELFGHEKGAFTDASDKRVGYIEAANGGVLFLDEIGELSESVQVKLLRFLEARRFSRLGSTAEIEVDLQIVCATHRDLKASVEKGSFREDLYYRIRTIEVSVPSLSERPTDIPLLADHFLQQHRSQTRCNVAGFSTSALNALKNYPFPGNVRELKSIIDRAVLFANRSDAQMISPEHLGRDIVSFESSDTPGVDQVEELNDGFSLDEALAKSELSYINRALDRAAGRKTEAASFLGLNDRFALLRRVKILRGQHPHLFEEFPTILKLYDSKEDTVA